MSQSSQNLVKSYENDVICEKNEENDDIRELQDQYESDAEYGDFDDYIPEGFYQGPCEGDGEYVLLYNGEEVGSMDFHDNTIMIQNSLLESCKEYYCGSDWSIIGY